MKQDALLLTAEFPATLCMAPDAAQIRPAQIRAHIRTAQPRPRTAAALPAGAAICALALLSLTFWSALIVHLVLA